MNDSIRDWLRTFVLVLLGAVGIAAFYDIEQTVIGRHISFGGSWGESPRSELYFWLGTTFLLLPAAGLIGWSVGGHIATLSEQQLRIGKFLRDRAGLIAGLLTLVACVFFALLNKHILLGFPFTDDEWGARFGGELLAGGHLTTEAPAWFDASPNLFLYLRDGAVTSFDWLGAMVPWALASWTGLDTYVFSVAAGLTVGAIAVGSAVRWGHGWGAAAGLLFVASPMALSLSATSHTHVWSRAFLAGALAAWLIASAGRSRIWWALAGGCAGMAWITRPIEVTALLGPLVLLELGHAARSRDRSTGTDLAAFLGAGALFVLAFVAHDFAVTGTLLPARLAGNNELVFPGAEHYQPPLAILSDWELLRQRFGANLAYNVMMFGVYGLSLPGLALAAFGVRDRFTGGLMAGLAAAFAVALLHDDYGLHMVGPIHYADAFVPFLFLVVSGLVRVHTWATEHDSDGTKWVSAVVVGLLIWGGVFSSEHLKAMRRQSTIHADVYKAIDAHPDAILLVDPYHETWRALPDRGTQTYVFDWRKNPDANRHPLLLKWSSQHGDAYRSAFEAFPDREVLRVVVSDGKVTTRPVSKELRGLQ